ncbi:MAG: hypothetical protein DA328_06355 [Nitrososphaeraceae archaeon]|nr:hypothetical protein [Nitrososphaeraceae archaeon]
MNDIYDVTPQITSWKKWVVEPIIKMENIDKLAEASLVLSKILDNNELDVNAYLNKIYEMGDDLKKIIEKQNMKRPTYIIETINFYLFNRKKFMPNIHDYYNPSNNYLDLVIDKKIGNPITLSILYITIGNLVNFKLYPVNFPTHFLIKHLLEDKNEIIIDPFNSGRIMDDYALKNILEKSKVYKNIPLTRKLVEKTSIRQVIIRILNNLKESYYEVQAFEKVNLANEMILAIEPNYSYAIRDKGIILLKENVNEALKMLNLYLEINPEADDADSILEIIRKMRTQNKR